MSQPDHISLSPWEQDPYEETRPAFHIEVDGRFFVVQLVGEFVRFRELTPRHKRGPSQWNFALRERVTQGADASETNLRARFENSWRRGYYVRIVCREYGNVVFLGRNGIGVIFERIGRATAKN